MMIAIVMDIQQVYTQSPLVALAIMEHQHITLKNVLQLWLLLSMEHLTKKAKKTKW